MLVKMLQFGSRIMMQNGMYAQEIRDKQCLSNTEHVPSGSGHDLIKLNGIGHISYQMSSHIMKNHLSRLLLSWSSYRSYHCIITYKKKISFYDCYHHDSFLATGLYLLVRTKSFVDHCSRYNIDFIYAHFYGTTSSYQQPMPILTQKIFS